MYIDCLTHYMYSAVSVEKKYRILQNFRGGKVSWLQNSIVIRWKTFAVGPSLPFFFYNLLSEGNYFTGKVLQLPTNPWKPRNFSTSNNLQYMVHDTYTLPHTIVAIASSYKLVKLFSYVYTYVKVVYTHMDFNLCLYYKIIIGHSKHQVVAITISQNICLCILHQFSFKNIFDVRNISTTLIVWDK